MNWILQNQLLTVVLISIVISLCWMFMTLWTYIIFQHNIRRLTTSINKIVDVLVTIDSRISTINKFIKEKHKDFEQ